MRGTSLLISAALFVADRGAGAVNLALEAAPDPAPVGQTVLVQILMGNDAVDEQLVAAMDVVLHWNPAELRLLGASASGPDPWLTSGFFTDPDGINDTFDDGNALFSALARAADPVAIPAGGTIVARVLEFEALAPAAVATIAIAAEQGQFGRTRVFEPSPPQSNVLGTFAGTSLEIICSDCPGDADGDGDVDVNDLTRLLAEFGASGGVSADLDCDGDVDVNDLTILLAQFGTVCTQGGRGPSLSTGK